MKRIYLDHASTTPLDPKVEAAMRPYLQDKFGNPSSLHSFGQDAMAALDKSRETLANLVGAKFSEIIFTSSATEANNMAVKGAVMGERREIIVSAVEHESILETARGLERWGVKVTYLPVDKNGFVDLNFLKLKLSQNTAVVSVMHANNETGVIQDIHKISEIIREFKSVNSSKLTVNSYPLLHTDAVQAFQYLDCNIDELGVDLMTLSSHKIYGPKGAGALYVRGLDSAGKKSAIAPLIVGGGQEFEMRSGTENIPAIVGFAKAAEMAVAIRQKEAARVAKLRDELWAGIKKHIKRAKLNGDETKRLPNNLSVYLPGVSAEEMLIKMDLNGIAVSAGSACTSRSVEPSHVLLAMGHDERRAKSSIRFTLGRMTGKPEIKRAIKVLTSFFRGIQ